jgi:hypothetical protein
MITIKLTNKLAYTLIAILAILTASLVVYAYTSIPNPGHGADTIEVTINGNEKTLQAAIDAGDFSGRKCQFKYVSSYNITQAINDGATGFCYWEPPTGNHAGFLRSKTDSTISCTNWEGISSDSYWLYVCK